MLSSLDCNKRSLQGVKVHLEESSITGVSCLSNHWPLIVTVIRENQNDKERVSLRCSI